MDAVYDDDIQLQFADSCGRNILRSAQQQLMAVIARHLPSNFNKLQILTFTMLDIYEKKQRILYNYNSIFATQFCYNDFSVISAGTYVALSNARFQHA